MVRAKSEERQACTLLLPEGYWIDVHSSPTKAARDLQGGSAVVTSETQVKEVRGVGMLSDLQGGSAVMTSEAQVKEVRGSACCQTCKGGAPS